MIRVYLDIFNQIPIQIKPVVLFLQGKVTIDVNPVTQSRTDRNTGRVPDCGPPDSIVSVNRVEQIPEYFPSEPLEVGKFAKSLLVFLSAPFEESVTICRRVAAQQIIFPVRDESLIWPAIRVSGEVVGEEPGTESQLRVFLQGGVQDLSPAVFSW